MKRFFFLAVCAGLSVSAHADDTTRFSLQDYPARVDEMKAACTAGSESPECRVALMSVLPSTIEALSYLGYNSTYDQAAPVLRQFAGSKAAELRAAAIYALARLGPKPEDFPVLRQALLSDSPGVRRAALGALKKTADPLAQELYERASTSPSYLPSGSYFEPDRLPFDPAQAGIATWPQNTRFLHFQRLANKGAYVFIADGDVASAVALFEAQAGTKAVGMGDIMARYGAEYGDLLASWAARNEKLGAVQAIVLNAPDKPSQAKPAFIAFVYDDYALGATGFALVNLPGASLPSLPQQTQQAAAPPPADPDHPWYEHGKFAPKEGAADDDVAAWKQVLDAEGDGAQAYLDAFPDGAYRSEAEAIATAPAIETDLDVYPETDPIKVHWRGVQPADGMSLTLGQVTDDSADSNMAQNRPEVQGAEGDAELQLYPYIDAGVYEVRLVDQNGQALATREIRIAMVSATLTLDAATVKPGADIHVSFSGMPGLPRDVISIAKKGTRRGDIGFVRAETGGKTEGSVTLRAPDEPGDYEVRASFNGEYRERGSVALTVKGPELPPEPADKSVPSLTLIAAEFETNEKIVIRYAGLGDEKGTYIALAEAGAPLSQYVSYVDAKGAEGTVEMKLPPEPGAYELRAFIGGKTDAAKATAALTLSVPAGAPMATFALDKTSYAPGETIGIDFKGMSGSKQDYFAISAPKDRYSRYVTYVYTKGEIDGHAELKAPTQPGSYEVRAFFDEREDILRGRVAFTVAGP